MATDSSNKETDFELPDMSEEGAKVVKPRVHASDSVCVSCES